MGLREMCVKDNRENILGISPEIVNKLICSSRLDILNHGMSCVSHKKGVLLPRSDTFTSTCQVLVYIQEYTYKDKHVTSK